MRLLDTYTGRFVENVDPNRACYAILSHVWDAKGEQSYQQVLAIWQNTERSHLASLSAGGEVCEAAISILDSPELSPKIKGFCALARRQECALGWIDSCCIDKTSSAELTEAINSMYHWYRKAEVCYAYLADVDNDPLTSPSPSREDLYQKFLTARWHTRGWTLQELIAPDYILFLTRSWSPIGSKLDLAKLLERATGVSAAVLTGEVAVESISVACRMSWASKRKTTRIEDEAYSLLGIFGVYMPTIYGEGRNAFLRLQQEIIKTIPDQSIFAWGVVPSYSGVESGGMKEWLLSIRPNCWLQEPGGLLAASPAAFIWGNNLVPISGAEFTSALGYPLPPIALPDLQCTFTPEGAHIRLPWYSSPVLDLSLHNLLPADGSISQDPPTLCSCDRKMAACIVALLRCRNRAGEIQALLLTAPADLLHSVCRSDESHLTRLTVCGAHDFGRRVIALPCRWKEWIKAPGLFEVLGEPSHIPLVIHPVGPALNAKYSMMFGHSPISLKLSPWCREGQLSAAGVEVSSLEPVFQLWPDAHHHLLLEHRNTDPFAGGSKSAAPSLGSWVLTSKIHIIVFQRQRLYGGLLFHVRHQAVLKMVTNHVTIDPYSKSCIETLSDLETAMIGDSTLLDSIWQTYQEPSPSFAYEYELPSHTGFPFRRLHLFAFAWQLERGRSAWLTVQFSGGEGVGALPASQSELGQRFFSADESSWETLAIAEVANGRKHATGSVNKMGSSNDVQYPG
ncbi:HET-domain-containing protein [Cubamyces sp. BRFM 1775]|nr:HET-domain-containing protein [Cubamyces sp. BRFM 1775]